MGSGPATRCTSTVRRAGSVHSGALLQISGGKPESHRETDTGAVGGLVRLAQRATRLLTRLTGARDMAGTILRQGPAGGSFRARLTDLDTPRLCEGKAGSATLNPFTVVSTTTNMKSKLFLPRPVGMSGTSRHPLHRKPSTGGAARAETGPSFTSKIRFFIAGARAGPRSMWNFAAGSTRATGRNCR